MYIRQPEISTSMVERQSLVIQPKAMHQRSLKVVNMNRMLCDVKSEVIRRA